MSPSYFGSESESHVSHTRKSVSHFINYRQVAAASRIIRFSSRYCCCFLFFFYRFWFSRLEDLSKQSSEIFVSSISWKHPSMRESLFLVLTAIKSRNGRKKRVPMFGCSNVFGPGGGNESATDFPHSSSRTLRRSMRADYLCTFPKFYF